MGKGKVGRDNRAGSESGGKSRSGARILLFSAVAAAGVVAVRRSRAVEPAASGGRVPHGGPVPEGPPGDLPEIPQASASVATAIAGNTVTEPISIVKSAEPSAPAASDQQSPAAPEAEDDVDEEPPIWAGVLDNGALDNGAPESVTASVPEAAPTSGFDAALAGEPIGYGQPFAPFDPLPAPPPSVTADGDTALIALHGEPWAGSANDFIGSPPGYGIPPAPPQALATEPSLPELEPVKRQGLVARLGSSRGRKITSWVGAVCLLALIVATIIVATAH